MQPRRGCRGRLSGRPLNASAAFACRSADQLGPSSRVYPDISHSQVWLLGALMLFDQRRPGLSDGTDEPRRTRLTHGPFCFSAEVWPVAMAEHLLPSPRRRRISGRLVWCVSSSCLLMLPLEGSLPSGAHDLTTAPAGARLDPDGVRRIRIVRGQRSNV